MNTRRPCVRGVSCLPCRVNASWPWWWGCRGDAAADCSSARSPSASAASAASGWAPRLKGRRRKEMNHNMTDAFVYSVAAKLPFGGIQYTMVHTMSTNTFVKKYKLENNRKSLFYSIILLLCCLYLYHSFTIWCLYTVYSCFYLLTSTAWCFFVPKS